MEKADIKPLKQYDYVQNLSLAQEGAELLKQGKAGCLIVAGGQGTRLGYNGPKGCFEISSGVTLFSMLSKKIHRSSFQSGRKLPVAIMTSQGNHQETVDYFKSHQYFELDPDQIDFFIQDELPVLSLEGTAMLDAEGNTIEAPAGNGVSLNAFAAQGLAKKWKSLGVEQVTFVQVDNLLSDPFDPLLLAYQSQGGQDVTLKAGLRGDTAEKVGVIVELNGRPGIVEYMEMDDEERIALNAHGKLLHACANLGMYCFRLDFIQKLYDMKALSLMPLHQARKSIPQANDELGYKSEYFIFDVLPFSEKTRVLLYPREDCFAPLKDRKDLDFLKTLLPKLN
ncbi:MAG: UTP--glucose-1-phosphate uridylyltransferase [Parachlamydiales bacterium]|jgi:UDP-N-acetylglucosamine/UDP-N-acetylgalactosamine diphosphorylase